MAKAKKSTKVTESTNVNEGLDNMMNESTVENVSSEITSEVSEGTTDADIAATIANALENAEGTSEETPAPVVEDTPEVKAVKEQIKALEAQRTEITKQIAALKVTIGVAKPKVEKAVKPWIFTTPEVAIDDIKTKHGKGLTVQTKWLLETFIPKDSKAGDKTEYTLEQVKEKLIEFPCSGDQLNNARWLCMQVLKPINLFA